MGPRHYSRSTSRAKHIETFADPSSASEKENWNGFGGGKYGYSSRSAAILKSENMETNLGNFHS